MWDACKYRKRQAKNHNQFLEYQHVEITAKEQMLSTCVIIGLVYNRRRPNRQA
jgi:hypothetical protein